MQSARFVPKALIVGALSLLLVPGCGGSNSRNFQKVIQVDGKPTLRVTCHYVGKSPGDPDSYKSSHNYRSTDTDFYRLTWENLTDHDMVIERVVYRLEKGEIRGQRFADTASIKRTWGTNRIPAYGKLSRANNMVYSKASSNTFFKTYHFRLLSKEEPTFHVEVPLVYDR